MADPLSAISLVIQVVQGFVHYCKSFRGYDSEIDSFVSSVERLSVNLQLIKDYIQSPVSQLDPEANLIRGQLEKNVAACSAATAELNRELQKLQPDSTKSGVRITIKNLGRQAAWHFRKDSLPRLRKTVADILGSLETGINHHQLAQIGFIRKAMIEIQTQQKVEKIRSWLAAPDQSIKHRGARQRRLAETASWIFDEPEFKSWVNNPGVLWLTGVPGSGKTVMSSAIIEKLKAETGSKVGHKVAYFYFQYNDSVNGSADMLIRSLIYQLSFTSTYCASEVENLYEACQAKGELPTLGELIVVLAELVRTFTGVFLVLDALDEAPEPSLLWQVLEALSTTKAHFLLVSRPNVEIRPEIQTLQPTGIQITTNKVDKDVRLIVKTRLGTDEKLRLFSELHPKIESTLVGKAGEVFILVDSQLNTLRGCRTAKKVNEALTSIPGDLAETWNRCFINIPQNDLDDSVRLLTWLCFSQRPVCVDELIDALAIPDDWFHAFDLAETRLKDPQALLDMGSGLVASDQNLIAGKNTTKGATVRLAHASVKEWLQSENASTKFPTGSPFKDSEGHSVLAQLCLRYLIRFNMEYKWTEQDFSNHPLADYSALYWRFHMSKSNFAPELIDLACRLLLNNTMRENWGRIRYRVDRAGNGHTSDWLDDWFDDRLPPWCRGSSLAYAAEYSLDPLVESLLCKHRLPVNDKNLWKTALEVAVENDRLSTVTILVDSGADVNITPRGFSLNSILALACWDSSVEIITYLLDKGAVDNESGLRKSALAYAASREDDVVTRLLLDRGHFINLQSDFDNCTALHEAARSLRLSNIRTLLNYGADKELKDRGGNLALHLAVQQEACTPEIAEMLKFKSSQLVENKDGDTPLVMSISGNRLVCMMILGETPDLHVSKSKMTMALIEAAARGFLDVVNMLHQRGAEFEEGGKWAIIEATTNGHTDVVRYLINHGQAIDVVDSDGRTALHFAAREGQFETFKVLYELGASLRATDNYDASVCHFAAANGHLGILQWLSDRGATMNLTDVNSSTPFLDAIQYGHLDCAKFLSTKTPDWNTHHLASGCTALALAAQGGHIDVAKWLFKKGADVNEQSDVSFSVFKRGEYALLYALDGLQFDMTRFLLENGADPNLSTSHGTTASLQAAEHQPLAYLKLLAEHRAQIQNVQDNDGDDALFCAVLNPDTEVLRWVIQLNVTWNTENKHGFSPMLRAALYNRVSSIKVLQDAGYTYSAPRQPDDNGTHENNIRKASVWYAFQCLKSHDQRIPMHNRYTPLMVSAFKGHLQVVQYFYTEFPDMQVCLDKDGNNALTYASCTGNLDVTMYLFGNGFGISRVNIAGRTVRQETEQCLSCLKADLLTEETEMGKAQLEAIISKVNLVLDFLEPWSNDAVKYIERMRELAMTRKRMW